MTLNRLPQGQTIVDQRDTQNNALKKALLADTSFCLLLVHIQLVTFEIIICAANWVTYKRIHVSFNKCQVTTNPSRLDGDAPKPLDFLAFHENEADLEEQMNPKCTINLILFNSNSRVFFIKDQCQFNSYRCVEMHQLKSNSINFISIPIQCTM